MAISTKILLCTHKLSDLPKDDIYLPIQVGKAISNIDLGIQGDNTGDNISEKNKNFCELTAMYWAWKNIKKLYPNLEYIGLCHYRRFFLLDRYQNGVQTNSLKTEEKIKKDLLSYQIILPKKNTWQYSLEIDYCLNHISSDYKLLRNTIYQKKPTYKHAFDKTMGTNNASFNNMFITKFSIFDEYCNWLFSILFELEKCINLNGHDEYQARVFGFMAERLFNVFIRHHSFSVKYYHIVFKEDETTIKVQKEKFKDTCKNYLMFLCIKILNKILG